MVLENPNLVSHDTHMLTSAQLRSAWGSKTARSSQVVSSSTHAVQTWITAFQMMPRRSQAAVLLAWCSTA